MPPNNEEDRFRSERILSVWLKFIKAYVNSRTPDDLSTMSLIPNSSYSPKINIPLGDAPGDFLNPWIKGYERGSDRLQDKYGFSNPDGKNSMYSREGRKQLDATFCANNLGSCVGESSAESLYKSLKSFFTKWHEINKTASNYREQLSDDDIRYPSGQGVTPIHVVKKGETLDDIANRYGVSKQELLDKNPWLNQKNIIQPNDKITIPKQFDLDELTRIQNNSNNTTSDFQNDIKNMTDYISAYKASAQYIENQDRFSDITFGQQSSFFDSLWNQYAHLSDPAYGLSYEHFNTHKKGPLDNDFINSLVDPYGVLSNTPSFANTAVGISNANSASNDALYIGGVIGSLGVGVGTMGSLSIGAGATAMGNAGVWAGITASGSSIGAAIAAAGTAIGSAIAAVGETIWGFILGFLVFL